MIAPSATLAENHLEMVYDNKQRPISQDKMKFIILTSNKNSLRVFP